MRTSQNISILILCLMFLQVLIACSRKRAVIITGFVYQGERVEVSYKEAKFTPFNFRVDNSSTGLQFFYEQRKLKGNSIEVKAIVDSAGLRLLDTLLLIPDHNKVPLISFLHPVTTHRRQLFLADSDTMRKY